MFGLLSRHTTAAAASATTARTSTLLGGGGGSALLRRVGGAHGRGMTRRSHAFPSIFTTPSFSPFSSSSSSLASSAGDDDLPPSSSTDSDDAPAEGEAPVELPSLEFENVTIEFHDEKARAATLTLNRPPVNSLNLELLTDIEKSIHALEAHGCRGFVLRSCNRSVFSGGLDINEMYKPDQERLQSFWMALQDAYIALVTTKMATVAAVEGHAPAGGCMLAMSCDHRIMSDTVSLRTGLNEVLLGIVAPFWFADLMTSVVGHRQADRLLQRGHMCSPQEAHSIGLMDRLAPQADVFSESKRELALLLALPSWEARGSTKQMMRMPIVNPLLENKEADVTNTVLFVEDEAIQTSLGQYMEALAKRKK
eukprot:TRINITY_DN17030_c0_g1_i1.p1 TRINITY_DN17030_c0_g1~~TRINITY_DN17030_c0_g1_i1.p1  ORF type:complete len:375 (-),score=81.63 TRINITY_DN17030_c0_g1_i1:121-1218(-)